MGVFVLKKGECGTVSFVGVVGAAGQRLNSLGIKKGAKICVIEYSFFGSSVLISCGYNRIAIRRAVAERIEVLSL